MVVVEVVVVEVVDVEVVVVVVVLVELVVEYGIVENGNPILLKKGYKNRKCKKKQNETLSMF